MEDIAITNYNKWVKNARDEEIADQLHVMAGNSDLIADAFYKDLEFGTAGLRGVMGAGTNRMNIYTITQTTKAIADYLIRIKGEQGTKTMVITYDSRINSARFARLVACVLAENGVKCYITNGCKPTPYLSFLVRTLGCDMGINVTSSHNPKEYNGYKVYERFGCQIGEAVASEISQIRNKINPFNIHCKDFGHYLANGAIAFVEERLEEEYLNAVQAESLCCAGAVQGEKLKVVYTALNGVGEPFVSKILKRIGVADIVYVQEQKAPNGEFPTCPYPNPEKAEALSLAVQYAKGCDADLIIATDPDSDRLGVMAKSRTAGEYVQISGNDVGVLLCEYVLRQRKVQGSLPAKPVVIRSIVTSPLVDEVVRAYGGEVVECLTGFKNIGGEIKKLEERGENGRVVFAFEESCGYLKGIYVRDKDGVESAMLMCELACALKANGVSVLEHLGRIRAEYGHYLNSTISVRFGGVDGERKKLALLANLHAHPLAEINKEKVVKVVDFFTQTELDIPKADVMKFVLQSGDVVILRPSGTEPLVKCYLTVKNGKDVQKLHALQSFINSILLND